MKFMTLPEAMKITGMSRKRIIGLMERGEWDIGEVHLNPETGYRKYIIWSNKLARVMGVPEAKVNAELAKIDERKRLGR